MPTFEATVHTPWKPEKAFLYMADLSRYDEWDPGTERAELISGTPGAEGSEYELTVGGKTLRYTVTGLEPTKTVVAQARDNSLDSKDTITIAARRSGSAVTYNANLKFRGLARLAAPILGMRFKSMSQKAAVGLANALDGTVVA